MSEVVKTKVVTGVVRGSYVNVFAPRHNEMNGKDEYSMCILIPKTDKACLKKLDDAIDAAVTKRWPSKVPANLRMPLRDGDEEDKGEEYAGHFFVNIRSAQRPGIVDRSKNPVMDPDDFISGDYCKVSVNAFAYDTKGNKGVSFGLNNIQVIERGEALTGRARAEDDFEDEDDGESADADLG